MMLYLYRQVPGIIVKSLLLVVITSSDLSHRQPPQLLYPLLTHEILDGKSLVFFNVVPTLGPGTTSDTPE